jgi:hypothetical protein
LTFIRICTRVQTFREGTLSDPTMQLRAALYASLLSASCALKLSAIDAGVASVAKLRPTDNKDAFFTAAPRLVTALVVVPRQRWRC